MMADRGIFLAKVIEEDMENINFNFVSWLDACVFRGCEQGNLKIEYRPNEYIYIYYI